MQREQPLPTAPSAPPCTRATRRCPCPLPCANTIQGRELSSASTATYQKKRSVWAITVICFPCRDVLTKAMLLSHAAVGREKGFTAKGNSVTGNQAERML